MLFAKIKTEFYREQLMLALRLAAWIGLPIVGALYLGDWLDRHWTTEPWGFLLSVGLAFPLTMVALVKEALQAINKYSDKK